MKILIVASHNKGRFAPFIIEQVDALQNAGIECKFFGVEGKGIKGYLSNLPKLKQAIKQFRPDIIHAHYGLSSLLANLQRNVPVVTTYHGSDINNKSVLIFSKLSTFLSAWNIFVSNKCISIAKPKSNYSLIPCGINLPKNIDELPDASHILEKDKKHVLFAGAFNNYIKNYPLAQEAINILTSKGINVQLIELKGYSRDEVFSLLYSCDALLMTSFTEGSPQIIKEAMVCGCPIVSVGVGDVMEIISNLDGCYISDRNSNKLANNLVKVLNFNKRTKGREKIIELGLTNELVAEKLTRIYKSVCHD
ncbi:MAG: glycosyltransferase [Paludibacteraceae bacterium]|nr:glycosyltransferase [Paludibacteraceae bacterium]